MAGKAFDCRFTGKDSRGFLRNFMYLIAAVEPFRKQGPRQEFTLHVLSYFCLNYCCVNVLLSLTALRLKMKILLINMLVEFISCSTLFFFHIYLIYTR